MEPDRYQTGTKIERGHMPTWTGKWKGGRTYETGDGRTVYVLRKMVEGVAYELTLDARSEADAEVELSAFRKNPSAYANAHRSVELSHASANPGINAVRVDTDTIDRFIRALEAEGLTDRYIGNVEHYLAAWSYDLKGRDLRRVTVRDLNAVLDSYPRQVEETETRRVITLAAARKHRISALKSLTAWLRKRGDLLPGEDASLSLQVPAPKPAKARKFAAGEAKGYEIALIESVYGALDGWRSKKYGWQGTDKRVDVQSVRDVLLLHCKTGMHGTEIERLARGEGTLRDVEGQGEIAGTITFVHKTGNVHVQSIDAQTVAAVRRLQARGSAPVDSYIRKVVKRATDRLKIKEPIRFGELRHSWVTWARTRGREVRPTDGGLSLEAIAAAIGHSSVRTTQRHYDQTKIPPMIAIPIRLVHADDPPYEHAPKKRGPRRPQKRAA